MIDEAMEKIGFGCRQRQQNFFDITITLQWYELRTKNMGKAALQVWYGM